jgi:hypothetical protein
MSAAPDFQTLYDFETPFEAALKGILVAAFAAVSPAPIVCQVTTQADAPLKDTPRVEIMFQPGNALSQRTTLGQAAPAKQVPNAFSGRFSVTIYATRTISSANNANLPAIRGLVRYALSAGAKGFTSQNLPYWQILDMNPSSSTPVIIDSKEQAGTELSYDLLFAISNSAWPGQG